MKTISFLLIFVNVYFGIQLGSAQNTPPVAVNDTMWTIPGYPVSVNALENDYDFEGDSIFIIGSQLSHEDGILYFHNTYNTYSVDTLVKRYYISDDPENWYNSYDTGYVYIIIDNPFYEYLDVNNVSAQFNNFGNHFWELPGGNGSTYFVPKESGQTPLFSSTVWIGGLDENDELHIAAELYRGWGMDFWSGPVSDIYDSVYDLEWNYVWKLNKEEIEHHQSHWWETGYQPIENIVT